MKIDKNLRDAIDKVNKNNWRNQYKRPLYVRVIGGMFGMFLFTSIVLLFFVGITAIMNSKPSSITEAELIQKQHNCILQHGTFNSYYQYITYEKITETRILTYSCNLPGDDNDNDNDDDDYVPSMSLLPSMSGLPGAP